MTIYCDTRYLEEQNARVGEALEWIPRGSGQSWKHLNNRFEGPIIVKFDISRYQHVPLVNQYYNGAPADPMDYGIGMRPTAAKFGAPMDLDARPTAPYMMNTGPGGGGVDSYDFVVPNNTRPGMGGEKRPDFSRVAFAARPRDPEYDAFLKFIGATKDDAARNPAWESYFKFMKDQQLDPYGLGFGATDVDSMSPGERGEMNSRLLMISQLAQHLGGFTDGDMIPRDAAGDHNWALMSGRLCQTIATNIAGGGLNLESAEYLYPNFEQNVAKLKAQKQTLYDDLVAHGVLKKVGGRHELNLVALSQATVDPGGLSPEAEDALKQYCGNGPAKYMFVAAVEALRRAVGSGVVLGDPARRPNVYTWDVMEEQAKMIDNLKQSGGGFAESIKDLHNMYDDYYTFITAGGLTSEPKAQALQDQMSQILSHLETRKEFNASLRRLLNSPIIGFDIKDIDDPTPEQIERGYTTLKNFETDYKNLFRAVNVTLPPGGVLNFKTGAKRLVAAYNQLLHENEHLAGDDRQPPALFSTASIDLMVRSQLGYKLDPTEQARLRGLYQYMREGRDGMPDIAHVERAISTLIRLSNDPDVQSWNAASAEFMSALNATDAKIAGAMDAAAANYFRTEHAASEDDEIVKPIIEDIRSKSSLDAIEVRYLPQLLRSVERHADFYGSPGMTQIEAAVTAVATAVVLAVNKKYSIRTASEHIDSASSNKIMAFKLWSASIGSGLYHPPVANTVAVWTDPDRYPERQMSSLVANTVCAGSLLHMIACGSPTKKSYEEWMANFHFRTRFTNTSQLEIRVVAARPEDARNALAELVKAMVASDPTVFENDVFRPLLQRKIGPSTVDADGYTDPRFKWGADGEVHTLLLGPSDGKFETFAAFYATQVKADPDGDAITVGAVGLLSDCMEIFQRYTEHNDQYGSKMIPSIVGAAFPKVGDADRAAVATRMAEVAKKIKNIDGKNFYTMFADILPATEQTLDVTQASTAACYWLDHPWSVVYMSRGIVKSDYVAVDPTIDSKIVSVARVLACPEDDSRIGALNKEGRWLQMLRPGGSTANLVTLYTAMAAGGGHDHLNGHLGDVAKQVTAAKFTPGMRAEATMELAKKYQSPTAFARRVNNIQKHAIRMKTAGLEAVQTAAVLTMATDHLATIPKVGTAGFFVSTDTVKDTMVEGTAVTRHNPDGTRWGRPGAPGAGLAIVPNPYARRFGTLLEMKKDMIRVMLNPALAHPVVSRHR